MGHKNVFIIIEVCKEHFFMKERSVNENLFIITKNMLNYIPVITENNILLSVCYKQV